MQGGNHVESQVGCVQFQKLVGSKERTIERHYVCR